MHDEAGIEGRIRLPTGRTVGWATYGDPQGRPAIAVHGSPDSHVIWELFDTAARARGIRLIAIDRPGFGISDPQHGRTVLDWPADALLVADHFAVDRFPLIAISGGAAYAAATAWKHPDRVTGLGLFSVIGPLDHPGSLKGTNRPVHASFIFGSWAARYLSEVGPPPQDVDVLIVGDAALRSVRRACAEVESELRIDINPVVVDRARWIAKRPDPFIHQVRSQPLVPIPLQLES